MTPQIFAAVYITAREFNNGRFYMESAVAAAEACKVHQIDPVWAKPIAVLVLTEYHDIYEWAKELI